MFTQQSQQLANIFGQYGDSRQTLAMMQTLGNCAQPLTTRAPIRIDGGSSGRPPRGGYFTNWPADGTGDWNSYSGGGWNPQDPSGLVPSDAGVGQTTPFPGLASPSRTRSNDGSYWGGDLFFGDTTLTNNTNTNVREWYQQTFTDNSYSDFRTMLDVQSNQYLQTVNNFGGDSYFDNTQVSGDTFNNNVYNEGDVFNYGPVTNEGDVYNTGETHIEGDNTFVNTEGSSQTLNEYIQNTVQNIVNNAGDFNINNSLTAYMTQIVIQVMGGGGAPTGGRYVPPPEKTYQAKGTIQVPKYKFDGNSCALVSDGTETVTVTLPVSRY